MSTTIELITRIARLTTDQQREVLDFVQSLQVSGRKPTLNLYGICADVASDLSFEDFQENRKELCKL